MLRFLASWLFRLILSHSVGDGNSQDGPCQDYQGLLTWRHQGRGGNSQEGSSGQGEEQSEEGSEEESESHIEEEESEDPLVSENVQHVAVPLVQHRQPDNQQSVYSLNIHLFNLVSFFISV